MKCIVLALAGAVLATPATAAPAWNASPYNWKNNASNWENSPSNWRNSPYNWRNSQANPNAGNTAHDKDGNRTGYAVRSRNGTINLFDERGNRTGYIPAED